MPASVVVSSLDRQPLLFDNFHRLRPKLGRIHPLGSGIHCNMPPFVLLNESLNSIFLVSYTHLDGYKRQDDARALGCEHWLNALKLSVFGNSGDAAWLRERQGKHGNLNDVVRAATERLMLGPEKSQLEELS